MNIEYHLNFVIVKQANDIIKKALRHQAIHDINKMASTLKTAQNINGKGGLFMMEKKRAWRVRVS